MAPSDGSSGIPPGDASVPAIQITSHVRLSLLSFPAHCLLALPSTWDCPSRPSSQTQPGGAGPCQATHWTQQVPTEFLDVSGTGITGRHRVGLIPNETYLPCRVLVARPA